MKNVITFHKSVISPQEEWAVFSFAQRAECWYRAPSFQQELPEGVDGTVMTSVQLYHILNSVHDIMTIEISATTIVPTRLWTHRVPHNGKQPRNNILDDHQGIGWYILMHHHNIWKHGHKRAKCSVLCLLLWCISFTYVNVSGHQKYRNKGRKSSPLYGKNLPPR